MKRNTRPSGSSDEERLSLKKAKKENGKENLDSDSSESIDVKIDWTEMTSVKGFCSGNADQKIAKNETESCVTFENDRDQTEIENGKDAKYKSGAVEIIGGMTRRIYNAGRYGKEYGNSCSSETEVEDTILEESVYSYDKQTDDSSDGKNSLKSNKEYRFLVDKLTELLIDVYGDMNSRSRSNESLSKCHSKRNIDDNSDKFSNASGEKIYPSSGKVSNERKNGDSSDGECSNSCQSAGGSDSSSETETNDEGLGKEASNYSSDDGVRNACGDENINLSLGVETNAKSHKEVKSDVSSVEKWNNSNMCDKENSFDAETNDEGLGMEECDNSDDEECDGNVRSRDEQTEKRKEEQSYSTEVTDDVAERQSNESSTSDESRPSNTSDEEIDSNIDEMNDDDLEEEGSCEEVTSESDDSDISSVDDDSTDVLDEESDESTDEEYSSSNESDESGNSSDAEMNSLGNEEGDNSSEDEVSDESSDNTDHGSDEELNGNDSGEIQSGTSVGEHYNTDVSDDLESDINTDKEYGISDVETISESLGEEECTSYGEETYSDWGEINFGSDEKNHKNNDISDEEDSSNCTEKKENNIGDRMTYCRGVKKEENGHSSDGPSFVAENVYALPNEKNCMEIGYSSSDLENSFDCAKGSSPPETDDEDIGNEKNTANKETSDESCCGGNSVSDMEGSKSNNDESLAFNNKLDLMSYGVTVIFPKDDTDSIRYVTRLKLRYFKDSFRETADERRKRKVAAKRKENIKTRTTRANIRKRNSEKMSRNSIKKKVGVKGKVEERTDDEEETSGEENEEQVRKYRGGKRKKKSNKNNDLDSDNGDKGEKYQKNGKNDEDSDEGDEEETGEENEDKNDDKSAEDEEDIEEDDEENIGEEDSEEDIEEEEDYEEEDEEDGDEDEDDDEDYIEVDEDSEVNDEDDVESNREEDVEEEDDEYAEIEEDDNDSAENKSDEDGDSNEDFEASDSDEQSSKKDKYESKTKKTKSEEMTKKVTKEQIRGKKNLAKRGKK